MLEWLPVTLDSLLEATRFLTSQSRDRSPPTNYFPLCWPCWDILAFHEKCQQCGGDSHPTVCFSCWLCISYYRKMRTWTIHVAFYSQWPKQNTTQHEKAFCHFEYRSFTPGSAIIFYVPLCFQNWITSLCTTFPMNNTSIVVTLHCPSQHSLYSSCSCLLLLGTHSLQLYV